MVVKLLAFQSQLLSIGKSRDSIWDVVVKCFILITTSRKHYNYNI